MKVAYRKPGLAIVVFTLFAGQVLANRIDSLQSDADVLSFLRIAREEFNSPKYKAIDLRSTETIRRDLDCNGVAEKWQVKNWEKADFNGDGLTDLLVTLYWYDYGVYVLMDKGNDTYDLFTLSYNVFEKCELAKSVKADGQQSVLFYQKKNHQERIDTLVYRYGGFIESNRTPAAYAIDSIQFRTDYCLGSCPVFTISFDKSGNALYNAGSYNPKNGNFSGVIRAAELEQLLSLVNYIDVTKLQSDYKVPWKEDQAVWLRVRFADGTVREIHDYGQRGTFGLRLLYDKFFALRNTQDWK